MRMPVHSRVGNAILGVIGGVYVIVAISLLVYAVVQTWAVQSLIDYAVQLVLVVAAAVGVFFVLTASENLGLHLPDRFSGLRHPRTHRKAAAAHH